MTSTPFLPALLWLAALQATPQPAPDSSDEIVVNGQRVTPQAIRKFVDEVTYQPLTRQISIWAERVCPKVIGLRPAIGARIEARLRQVARDGGLAVAEGECAPNILLFVVPAKQQFLEELARRDSLYFDEIPSWRVREIVSHPSRAVAWHLADSGADVDDLDALLPRQKSQLPGLNVPASVPAFRTAIVVVDASAIDGLTITQLADYAAMRAFIRSRPDRLRGGPATSILSVIDAPPDADVPLSLTAWDRGLLRGLYGGAANRWANSKRNEIGQEIARQVTDGQKPE